MKTGFTCPVCNAVLSEEEKSYVCENGHAFDRAKQGYVNLLLSNKQGIHGDDKLMVKARRSFLEKGYYAPMRQAANEILGEGHTVLDAGCGEGYYTALFAESNTVYGVDVSKEAVKSASGKCKKAHFAVGSVYALPFLDNSFDTVINIFAPDSHEEYLRVTKKGGRLITVTPMENHLMELKNAVYENTYKNPYVDPERDGYVIKSSREIKYSIKLESNEDIVSLFAMTPYYYKTAPSDRQKLEKIDSLETGVEFLITEYEKI